MTIKSFKTIGFGILSGAIGGAISGALLVFAWMVAIALSEGPMPPNELLAIPAFAIFGAIYGLVGGMAAGLIGGVLLLSLFSAENAPTVGKWFGLLIGAVVAGYFSMTLESSVYVNLFVIALVVAGAVAGAFGGRIAGRLLCWFMQDDPWLLERKASTV